MGPLGFENVFNFLLRSELKLNGSKEGTLVNIEKKYKSYLYIYIDAIESQKKGSIWGILIKCVPNVNRTFSLFQTKILKVWKLK